MLVLVFFFAVLATEPKDSHSLSVEMCLHTGRILSTISVLDNSCLPSPVKSCRTKNGEEHA